MNFEDLLEGAEKHDPDEVIDRDIIEKYYKLSQPSPDQSEDEPFDEMDKWWKEKFGMNVGTRRAFAEGMKLADDDPENIILSAVYLGYLVAESKTESPQ